MNTNRWAYVIGGTGLVGVELLQLLKEQSDYTKIVAFVRKMPQHPAEGITYQIIDFQNISTLNLEPDSDCFCCLGTTIKAAGTQDNFKKVDLEYVLEFAKLACNYDAHFLGIISAIGANEKSRIFYSRIKGEMEKQVQKLALKKVAIIRPSLLLGDRSTLGQPQRIVEVVFEKISHALDFLFYGPLAQYRPVAARKVAENLLQSAQADDNSSFLIKIVHG